MVVDPVMPGKGPSDPCENGIVFAKFVGPNKRPTSVNCDESSKTAGRMWWNVKTPSCEAAVRNPGCASSGVISIMFQGIWPGFKTKVSFEIAHCGAVGPQQKVDPETSEASGQRQSKIIPRSETWREKRGDTFTGGRCRSTQIQHGRHAPPGAPNGGPRKEVVRLALHRRYVAGEHWPGHLTRGVVKLQFVTVQFRRETGLGQCLVRHRAGVRHHAG